MKKLIFPLLTASIIMLTAGVSNAQFEGRIIYDSYQVDANGERQKGDKFTMHVTPDRILLQGNNKYDFVGTIKTEGVLVRLDSEDFVFLTGNDEALQISKADITSMMNMFGDNNSSKANPDINYRQTGETKSIKGYSCEKFVFTDKKNRERTSEIWMTNELDINWGMLSGPWGNKTKEMMGDGLPVNLIFDEGYFPITIESYRKGNLIGVMEAAEISESSVARAMVQIPSGVKVLSFQDYLFQKMSQQ